jgi:2-iminobutanoate/2-iminopropanoate deaminase
MWSDDHLSDPAVHPPRLTLGAGTRLGGAEPLFADATRWGDLLMLSGRADVDPATGAVRSDDFEGQARRVLADAFGVLAAGGSQPRDVLRVECYLADAGDFPAWNEIFAASFPAPRPVRTTLVAGFALPGLLIEIQLTAVARG